MTVSATVEVNVTLEEDKSQPTGYRFVNLKIGDEPTIPIPVDKPVPRRFLQVLVAAAKATLGAPVAAKHATTPSLPTATNPTIPMPTPTAPQIPVEPPRRPT